MSWKSLSDIYSESVVQNNNINTHEPPRKEWKSLSDVYTEGTKGNYINEATVRIKVDDGETKEFTLSDIYVQKILGLAYFAENSLYEKITEWVGSGGWKGNAIKRIAEQINTILTEVFPNEINERKSIAAIRNDIVQIMASKEEGAFATFIIKAAESGSKGPMDEKTQKHMGNNLFNLIYNEELQFLNNLKFLSLMCQITFTENQVNVGPGEVAITLFTEAKNPEKGDFEVKNIGIVELKGTEGRVGDGKIEMKVYNDVISKAIDNPSIDDKIFNEIKKIQNSNSGYLKNRILDFKGVEETHNLYKILNLIYGSQNLKQFLDSSKEINTTEKELIQRLDRLKIKKFNESDLKALEEFKGAAKKMISLAFRIYNLKKGREGKEGLKFSIFFNKDVVDEEEKIETLYKYVRGTLTPDIEKAIRDAYITGTPVNRIIGAISMVNYQRETNFKYIIFANTLPDTIQSGLMMCSVFGPFTNDYGNDLKRVLGGISDITFQSAHDRGGFKAAFIGPSLLPEQPPATGAETGSSEPSLSVSNSIGASPAVNQGYTLSPQAEGEKLNIPT